MDQIQPPDDSELPRDSDAALAGIVERFEFEPELPERAGGEPELPQRIGDYTIVEWLGEGGMGKVGRARQSGSRRDVALKLLQQRYARKPQIVKYFRESVEAIANLKDRNVVTVYDTSGLGAERPFYAMQLVSGGTLAGRDAKKRFRDPVCAARLLIKIAHAVQHAHEEGVLHLDLKPSNILLDLRDEPYVTDFIGRRVDAQLLDVPEGTLPYMAPEQATAEYVRIWTDVYGLGALFYELLTGEPPLSVKTLDELRKVDRAQEMHRWRGALSGVKVELKEICLTALSSDPRDRYASAALLAKSLACALDDEPVPFPPTPRRRRLKLWIRRHPVLAIGAALGLILLLAADLAMLTQARSEQGRLRDEVLRNNAALAHAHAHGLLASVKKYADYTLQAASLPAVRELLVRGPWIEPAPPLREAYERADVLGADALFVVDTQGTLVSRWPPMPVVTLGNDFRFRDYYQCAKTLAQTAGKAVCITPAFRSESNEAIHFAFSSPIYDPSGVWLGALVLSRQASHTFGAIAFNDRLRRGRLTFVIGGRGPDRKRRANREELILVAHPELGGNDALGLDRALATRLRTHFHLQAFGGHFDASDRLPLTDESYRDPAAPAPETMLASFAPIGHTGYLVAVATPERDAIDPNQKLITRLFVYGSVLNLSFLLIAGVAVWTSLRDPARERRPSA